MTAKSTMPAERRSGALSEIVDGFLLLARGFGMYWRSPRLLLLGMIPAVVSLLVVFGAFGTLVYFISDLSALTTWFADDWSSTARTSARIVAGAAIVAAGLIVALVTFTALTLIIGDPFYEAIAERVDEQMGLGGDGADLPWYRTLPRNLADSVRLLLISLCVSVPLFLAGLLPLIGQTVVPVADAIIGGWLITVELIGVSFNLRGLWLADRRRLLGEHRWLAIGFGVPVFLALLIPFAAVIVIPAAVAGGTLLKHRLLGLDRADDRVTDRADYRVSIPESRSASPEIWSTSNGTRP